MQLNIIFSNKSYYADSTIITCCSELCAKKTNRKRPLNEVPSCFAYSPLYRSFILVFGKLLYEYQPIPQNGCFFNAKALFIQKKIIFFYPTPSAGVNQTKYKKGREQSAQAAYSPSLYLSLYLYRVFWVFKKTFCFFGFSDNNYELCIMNYALCIKKQWCLCLRKYWSFLYPWLSRSRWSVCRQGMSLPEVSDFLALRR